MRPEELLDQADALLDVYGWRYSGNLYTNKHGNEVQLNPPEKSNKGLLTPTSLISAYNCERRLFLNRHPNSPDKEYININGVMERSESAVSIGGLEGTTIHDALYYIISSIKEPSNRYNGLRWKVALAPSIHASVTRNIEPLLTADKRTRKMLGDFENGVSSIIEKITSIAKTLWARKIGMIDFDRASWYTQLTALQIMPEVSLMKGDLVGKSDLIALVGGKNWIIDYKTGRLPQYFEERYSKDEMIEILTDPGHELNAYAIQLACYAWMLGDGRTVTRAILVYTTTDPVTTIEFEIGSEVLAIIDTRIKEATSFVRGVVDSLTCPTGSYNIFTCVQCPYGMNCQGLYLGGQSFFSSTYDKQNKKIPLLVDVKNIELEESCILVSINRAETSVNVSHKHFHYLDLAKSIVDEGLNVRAYLIVKEHEGNLYSSVVQFSRCA